MITTDYNLKYFPNGVQPTPSSIAPLLAKDLIDRAEAIYSRILQEKQPSKTCLQSASNSLRRSVGRIHLENKPVFEDDGQCAGACKWFIALFFHLKTKYPEVSTHQLLTQICKEFADGVGIQGALLQKYGHEEILHSLNLNRGNRTEIDLKNKDAQIEILNEIYKLSDGVYTLSFSGCPGGRMGWGTVDAIPGHATAIIIENKDYYFFEPNLGLLGTGVNIGSENKIGDVALFLQICTLYSPYERANELFKQGLEQLAEMFNPKDAKFFREACLRYRKEGRANLSIDEAGTIHAYFTEEKKYVFSRKNLLLALCFKPDLLQFRLESAEALRLHQYTHQTYT